MKTLHKFIIKSYIGPFVLTLVISIFILLMQFLWKYIDDLVGKGLEWYIIGKLMFYASATLVPLALPLAILLSSIMAFGNLGENYELVALKSAGLSLLRIMFPLIIISVFISITAFYFSNNVLPYVNLKMGSLLYDVRDQKPALNIRPGIFYNGIDGYSIRAAKKEDDGKTLRDIMIYDHISRMGNNKVIIAESGKLEMSPDKMFLIVSLTNGYSYEEMINVADIRKGHPLFRNQFQEEKMRFDLSGFKLTRTDEDLFKNNYQMLNLKQLENAIDSFEVRKERNKEEFSKQFSNINNYSRANNYISKVDSISSSNNDTVLLSKFTKSERLKILEISTNMAQSSKAYIESTMNEFNATDDIITKHEIEWNKKFTLSFACFVLFFIGAPLGAIIRKGGFGMPFVVSVVFFILFHVISIIGEKSAKEGVILAYQGMWLPTLVLLPIGFFLTFKATTDSSLFDLETYLRPFKKKFKQK